MMAISVLIFTLITLSAHPSLSLPNGVRELLASVELSDKTQPEFIPGVDPVAYMTFCEIVDYYGYKCEEYLHEVVTEDGFLLTMHRITGRKGQPSNFTKPPIFIQHGLLCDSTSWILNTPKDSLPFMLSDAGYDVWLGNSRGNTYSRAHQTLKEDSDAFWAWSWDEMAMYDLPASIDFVLSHTGYERLYYIGHSQGTLIAFAHLSNTQTDKIIYVIALAPVFELGHMSSPLKYLAPFSSDIAWVLEFLGIRDFLPNDWIIKFLATFLCDKTDPLHKLCGNILLVIAGFDKKELNESRTDVYINHAPAGTSVRNMLHFVQMYKSNATRRYDYGSAKENERHYGTPVPPAYNLSAITKPPMTIYWGGDDWLADPLDVRYIFKNLQTLREVFYLPVWDHLDFIWAIDARKVLYESVLEQVKRH